MSDMIQYDTILHSRIRAHNDDMDDDVNDTDDDDDVNFDMDDDQQLHLKVIGSIESEQPVLTIELPGSKIEKERKVIYEIGQ